MTTGTDPSQYLFIIGCCGALIMTAESYLLEYDMISNILEPYQVLYIAGFSICLFINYSIAPYFLRNYGATFYNLSFLTSSLYGLIYELLVLGTSFEYLYLIGFGCVMLGILLYNLPSSQSQESRDLLPESINSSYNKENLDGINNKE